MVSLIMSNPVFREIYEEFFKILPTDTLTQHANDSHEMSSLIIFEKEKKIILRLSAARNLGALRVRASAKTVDSDHPVHLHSLVMVIALHCYIL